MLFGVSKGLQGKMIFFSLTTTTATYSSHLHPHEMAVIGKGKQYRVGLTPWLIQLKKILI